MSNYVLGALAMVGLGGFVVFALYSRLTAKYRGRRPLRKLCEEMGGKLQKPPHRNVGVIAELSYAGHVFTATIVYTPMWRSWISSSHVECDLGGRLMPDFSVTASRGVGTLGKLGDDRRFKNLLLETEKRPDRDLLRALWPESAKHKMARLINPRQLREAWLPALNGGIRCEGSKLAFSRVPGFKRAESYKLVVEMMSELLDAAKSSSNRSDAAAGSGQ